MYSEWTHLLEIEWRWSLCALALEISFVSLMRALFSTYRWAYSCKQLGLGKIGGYINFSILHSCFYLSSKTTAALIPCTLLGMAGCIWSKIPAILMQTEPIWKQLGNGTLYSVARVVQWLPKGVFHIPNLDRRLSYTLFIWYFSSSEKSSSRMKLS